MCKYSWLSRALETTQRGSRGHIETRVMENLKYDPSCQRSDNTEDDQPSLDRSPLAHSEGQTVATKPSGYLPGRPRTRASDSESKCSLLCTGVVCEAVLSTVTEGTLEGLIAIHE